jgi:hypothetical protein
MSKILITNAFSLNMLVSLTANIKTEELTVPQVKEELENGYESGMGHSTELISEILGMDIPQNRTSNKIQDGESILVAQYVGPRLPEGATELPENASLKFIKVTVTYG